MSDAIEARQNTPFPAEAPPPVALPDPLAGDWSEGLRAAARSLGIPEPKLLLIEQIAPPPPLPLPAPAPVAETVEAPDAWAAAGEDPLQSQPPPVQVQPPPAPMPEVTPPSPAPAFLPDITPPSPAPAFDAEKTPPPAVEARAEEWSAPPSVVIAPPNGEPSTPWSEPVAPPPAPPDPWAQAPVSIAPAEAKESPWGGVSAAGAEAAVSPAPAAEGWAMPPPPEPAAPVVAEQWSTPPVPAAAEEWKPDETSDEWQQIKKAQVPELGAARAADWGSLSKGPDWAAPPPADPAPAADDAWGAPPPPPAESAWGAAPADAAPAADEWAAPPPVAAAPAPQAGWGGPAEESERSAPAAKSWNAPPAGASALEQLESEPESIDAAPEAAKSLFGSVPMGSSLAGEDDEAAPSEALEELPAEAIEEKPVELSDDDADLLVPVDDEPARPPRPPAQPLAHLVPVSTNALEVAGEHRVAVHTRGGRTVRGTVRDIDLSKPHFALAPQGGGDAAPVYHSDVKAIFFMLAPGEKTKHGDGRKVRVTFSDGRSIDGHRDGGEGKHGFFIVPLDAQRTNLRRIYVAREATSEVKDI